MRLSGGAVTALLSEGNNWDQAAYNVSGGMML